MRRRLTLSAAIVLVSFLLVGNAGAQDVIDAGGATPDDTVQMMKLALIGTSIVLLLLTILFWIHTDPKRRAKIFARKVDRNAAFDQLPIEVPEAVPPVVAQPHAPPAVAQPAVTVVRRVVESPTELPIMASSMPDESDILGEVG